MQTTQYLDYIGSWGPMILGHNPDFVLQAVQEQMQYGLSYGTATALEVEMAELISEIVPCVEMIRMVNSGTEAVMSAVRAARGFTGRDKIIKFAGCYHGHADAMLVKAGSGVMTAGIPDSRCRERKSVVRTISERSRLCDCRASCSKYGGCSSKGRLFAAVADAVQSVWSIVDF